MSLAEEDAALRQAQPDLSVGERMHILAQPLRETPAPLPVYPESLLTRGEALSIWKRRASLFGLGVVLHSGFQVNLFSVHRHPNLECVLGVTPAGELVTEYFPRGSASAPLASGLALRLILGVCAGLEFLRERGLPGKGRGLRPSDILISENWEARLSQRLLLAPDAPEAGDVSGVLRVLGQLVPRPSDPLAAALRHPRPGLGFDAMFKEFRALAKRDADLADEAVQAFVLGV